MQPDNHISRRHFLKQLSLTSIVLLPGAQTLSELVDSADPAQPLDDFFIDAAFRLMYYQQMLELEFYFINVKVESQGQVLCPLFSQPSHLRAYMVVRLPQQHIAEEYLDATCLREQPDIAKGKLQQSRIAGYSYLCFSIAFDRLQQGLPVTAQELMNWNAEHFSLISKPGTNIKPFILDPRTAEQELPRDSTADPDLRPPDPYPLGYLTSKGKPAYGRRYYPNQRNYPGGLRSTQAPETRQVRDQAPFTALEIPYRLILSPRLPSWEYDYYWVFTSFLGVAACADAAAPAELWMATLTLRRKKGHSLSGARANQPSAAQTQPDTADKPPANNEETINAGENQLQLMILGPATAGEYFGGRPGPAGASPVADPPQLLPTPQDRLDLVRLSSNFDLTATAPALTFTPLGVCTQLAFRNTYFEKDLISLYQWKQAISFGRDQEVEVANVVVDATFGLKMLHVRTTRRETVRGRSPLIYREFLMPLELEKDFASYPPDQDHSTAYQQTNYKYATPFQRVRFPDGAPRQILPLRRLQADLCVRMSPAERRAQDALRQVTPNSLKTGQIALLQARADSLAARRRGKIGDRTCDPTAPEALVLAFWAVTPDHQLLEWPMIFTDWLGQETTLRRRLYLLKSELNLNRDTQQHPAYDYQAPGNEAAATLAVGAQSADILPLPPGGLDTSALRILATQGGALEAANAILAKLTDALKTASAEDKSTQIRRVFEQIWRLDARGQWAKSFIWSGVSSALAAAGINGAAQKPYEDWLTAATKPITWRSIRQQAEEFGLHTLDVLRGGIQVQLETIERKLTAISTAGARDVEDAVLEEWGRCKRNVLGLGLTWENQLASLLHKAEELVQQINDAQVAAIAGEAAPDAQGNLLVQQAAQVLLAPAAAPAALAKLRGLLTGLLRDVARGALSPAQFQALTSDSTNVLNDLQQLTKITILDAGGRAVVAVAQVVSNYQDLAAYWRQASERIGASLLTELGAAYEYARFVGRLPDAIQQEVRRELDEHLAQLRAFTTYIGYFEQGCKSRIAAEKALVCYAVHQADDELEVLKRALDTKWRKKYQDASQQVLRQKAEWLRDLETFGKDFGYAASGHLATMRTDFLLFRNNLRLLETTLKTEVDGVEKIVKSKVFDIFNAYPCYPQLHTAQVYAAAINDLARREIPLKIKYAQDYVRSQLDNLGLEVKNNAARLFAEVHHEAQEVLKGALREAGKELGGLVNPEVAGRYLTLLKDGSAQAQATLDALKQEGSALASTLRENSRVALQTANADLNELLNRYAAARDVATQYGQEFDRLRNGLLTLTEAAKQELKAAEQDVRVQASAFFKGLEAKILGSIRLRDLLGADFNLPQLTRLPEQVSYQFITRNFRPFDVKVFRFVPNERTTLQAYLEIPTRHPENFQSQTQLSDFTLSIFDERLLVEFKRIALSSNKDVKNKTSVELGQIGFGKELEFLAALAKGFMIPGTGLKVQPSPTDISITYALPIPGVSGGAFTFDNLKVNVGIAIPIPTGLGATNQPLAIKFGLNGPTDPFVIGVLIFGGMGHFLVETTPKYLKRVDTGLSFGGLLRINLGIAVGQAYLQAGIRYVYERQPTGESKMELYALLTCGANVTVFGFIEISVVFTMYLKYQKDSEGAALYGVASVACSVRIGFFSKSFTLTFSKRFAGGSNSPAQPVPARPRREAVAGPGGQSPVEAADTGRPPTGNPAATAPPAGQPQPASPTPAAVPRPETLTERPSLTVVAPSPTPRRDQRRLNRLERRRGRAQLAFQRMEQRLNRAEDRLAAARRREYERQAAHYRTADALADASQALCQLQYLYESYSFTVF